MVVFNPGLGSACHVFDQAMSTGARQMTSLLLRGFEVEGFELKLYG